MPHKPPVLKNSARSIKTTIKQKDVSKIKLFIDNFRLISWKKHYQMIKLKDHVINLLERALDTEAADRKSIQNELEQKLYQKTIEAEKWKEPFSVSGNRGTPALPTQEEVVAGPYFCDPHSLQRLKSELKQLFTEKLGESRLPNDKQWQMILSENPLTCVNAGAGSGKSTTLILRLFVMRRFLKIPWTNISVFTFTRNSRWDLIEKLITTFEKLGEQIDFSTAKNTIRTFHSYACLLEMKSSEAKSNIIFELVGKKARPPKFQNKVLKEKYTNELSDDDFDVESPLAQENDDDDDPIFINEALKSIYHKAFEKSEKFREKIRHLFFASLSLKIAEDRSYNKDIKFIQDNDKRVTEYLGSIFGDLKGLEDVFEIGIDQYAINGDVGKNQLFFNAKVKDTGQLVLFFPTNLSDDVTLPGTTFKPAYLIRAKRTLLHHKSNILPLIIGTRNELVTLTNYLRHFQLDEVKDAPAFDYEPGGEFTSKSDGHISIRFFSLIQFVENFSLDFGDWAKNVKLSEQQKNDQHFVEASKIFHQFYVEFLRENGYVSFNQLFLKIQPNKLELVQERNKKIREKMMHVLIDEFQDITPLYAAYVKAIKMSLAVESKQAGSILTVGDDFQSIYGWKGSLVDFIVDFDAQFKTYQPPLVINMERNHRCTQKIIHFAENIIEAIPPAYRTTKKGIAVREFVSDLLPRIFIVPKNNPTKRIASFIMDEMAIANPTPDHPLLVLARGGKVISKLKTMLGHQPCIKMMTFHSSKGLEAESVILIGDCFYNGINHIKNDVMRQFRRQTAPGTEFDRMQSREAIRLAYVAATRSARRCHWILEESSDQSTHSAVRILIEEAARRQPPLCDLVKISGNERLLPM